MNKQEKNKQFMTNYYRELIIAKQEGPEAFLTTARRFIKDQKLIDHIEFLQKAFPKGILIVEDMMAEEDRVFVKITYSGLHEGNMDGIPATYREVAVPFALCYTIREEMIVDFWAIANEMDFFEQLGMTKEQVEVPPEEKN